jgi:hypothetical protein
MSLADWSPVKIMNMETINPNTAATAILILANTTERFFKRNQELMPITKTEANTYPEEMVCRNLFMATGENNTSQKLLISFRAVSGLK